MAKPFKKRAVILLFLCAFFCSGFSARREIRITLTDGTDTYYLCACENKKTQSIIDKVFGLNYRRRAEKLKGEGKNNGEILDYLFDGFTAKAEMLFEELKIPSVDASVKFNPCDKERFCYTDEICGREVDKEKLYAAIIAHLADKNISVCMEYVAVQPAITRATLVANTVKRGGFKTYYGYSSAPRKSNIQRAVSHINGTIIPANEVFSFNGVVGARTAARGYEEAPIISDGKFIGGVGGGVCQVSTTLYNAVLYSDLPVLTVSRHSLPVHYVQPSFDAMVSSISDLRFANDTPYPLYIEAYCKEGYVYFDIYGAPNKYSIKLIGTKLRDIPYDTEYLPDDNLYKGEERVLNEGLCGLESEGYIVRTLDGREVSRTKIRTDKYAAVTRKVARGTLKPPEISHNY